jgi:pyrroloquinoline quinone biosynthesis protein D
VNARARPCFAKGVKLRRDAEDGVMLLVPEGALVLNRTAAAALELVDGKRTLTQIVDAIAERFEVAPERARDDIDDLFDRLTQRGFVRCLP